MSGFFGSVLTDRTGKFNRQDDFANLNIADANPGYDFEDTYDGLGDQLEEDGDDFNDDTFGVAEVGKDFDFSGRTADVAETLEEEHLTFERRQPQNQRSAIDQTTNSRLPSAVDTVSTGPVNSANTWGPPSRNPNASSIWGQTGPSAPQQPFYAVTRAPEQSTTRKFQTLEEVEAAMLASSKANIEPSRPLGLPNINQVPSAGSGLSNAPPGYGPASTVNPAASAPFARQLPPGMGPATGIRPDIPSANAREHRLPSSNHQQQIPQPSLQSYAPVLRTQANPQASTSDDEATLQLQRQKNLRRAQKIGQMARYNGIMSNGDKNYVLKVQISQLVSEDPEADDFYYTVHSTLRGRTNVQQSLGHYEQTYLSRAGQTNRRGNRDKQNPMLKMQQQVQKIIASAKSRPKSTSLAVEGSLGKLSFSRVRQPKQVLNVKMPESSGLVQKQTKKEALQNIETVYNTLLLLEHTGRQPPVNTAESSAADTWEKTMDSLSEQIWTSLHIMDEVDNSQLHPFIQLLQYAKGKKLIPRLYRTLNFDRRLTLMTMIVAHLDMLDVVRLARYDEAGSLPSHVREDIELFTQTVLPPLLVFASNASMRIVVGLLNMLLERNHIQLLCMSKVGLSFMTMFISRAEIAKQAEQLDGAELEAWHNVYNRMFSLMEGKFSYIFPPPSHQMDEIYPWQFLAACAVSASPEQQHSLVNEARDRVLDNVQSTKTLPRELADIKRSNVNLFLNAIGLDASQLEG
ncbi:DNA topoisomerase 2-associated protein pat1 [Taphrina deformans PYCC 5710]|uniref:DNA topoisomerase 2-associated protein pat1 n=1 Tax=Taphrina deformans (strain PYCC 5710 / ATCC 11124 / CBS 356.35 / IMI 108563 / JCM 9778 / NBRC 8474) TaxID=1097556 RepID=R4XE29_TAPDE|nr:DNA topoisomerase 2-associated protein pat1 [Taphrina deformans PYCC 5710]|eukprot:CCG81588.1 DNA topoisomerase 2-associated protein pat1 [Taphrina deformans PYCC 5710]